MVAHAAEEKSRPEGSFPIVTVLLVALAIRLFVALLALRAFPDGSEFYHYDTADYFEPAMSLVQQGRFAKLDGAPELLRTPGYPLFLVPGILLGHPVVVPILLQILLSCGTVYLVFQSGILLFRRADIAGLGALLYALEPTNALYANRLASETLFVFLLMVFLQQFLGYLRNNAWLRLICSALALSAAVYVRPVGYYLPLVLAGCLVAWILFQPRNKIMRLVHAGVFLGVSMGLMGLWQIRNLQQAGYPDFSTARDRNLYFFGAAATLAAQEGIPWREMQRRMGAGDEEIYLQNHPDQHHWSEGARYQQMHREALRILLKHPFVYARIHAFGMFMVVASPLDYTYLRLLGVDRNRYQFVKTVFLREGFVQAALQWLRESQSGFRLVLILGLILWSYLLLSAVGLVSLRPIREMTVITLLVFGLYFVVISGGPQADSRYRHPLMPLICILAGYGCYASWGFFDSWRSLHKRAPLPPTPSRAARTAAIP